nr:DUF2892 domain-containing protein [Brevibacillus laterosporus]
MKKNVGTVDAFIRITVGLVGFGCAISKMSTYRYGRKPYGLLLLLSAMRVAEGITRFCPILFAFGISTRKEDLVRQAMDKFIPTGLSLYNKTREAASSMTKRTTKHTSSEQEHVNTQNEQSPSPHAENEHEEEIARKAFESFVKSDQSNQKQSTHQEKSHQKSSGNHTTE